MANKQTRRYRKAGYSRRVLKGQSSDIGKLNGSAAEDVELEIFKGRPCETSFKNRGKNPQNKRKSAWLGAKKAV